MAKQKEVGRNLLMRAKSLLATIPDDAIYLAQMCYRLAEQAEKEADNAQVINWLEEAFQAIQQAPTADVSSVPSSTSNNVAWNELQSNLLRWMTDKYIELREFVKAGATLTLVSQKVARHSAQSLETLQLLAKLHMCAKDVELAEKNMTELVAHPGATLTM
jgi:hypothetical protein